MTIESWRHAMESALLQRWYAPTQPQTIERQTTEGPAQRTRAAIARWFVALFWFAPARPLAAIVAHHAARQRRRINAARSLRAQSSASGPVIVVVGNLVAGGGGKSPLVLALVRLLVAAGHPCGIVTRSYRAPRAPDSPLAVRPDSSVDEVGDEPLMLARASGVPVYTGPRRAESLHALTAAHPDCTVVLCDDGLQHRALPRDLEILVIDERGFGNGRCLPAGPLREPVAAALASTDAIVANAQDGVLPGNLSRHLPSPPPPCFASCLAPLDFCTLDGQQRWSITAFVALAGNSTLTAFAGIARPERFFETLRRIGLNPQTIALPDHARIDPDWAAALPGQWLITTAKDATKLPAHGTTAARCVVLTMQAQPDPGLLHWLEERLSVLRPGQMPAPPSRRS